MCPRRPCRPCWVLQFCSPFPHPFVSRCLNLCHLSFFFYLFSTDVIFSHHLGGSHQGWRSPPTVPPPSFPSFPPSRVLYVVFPSLHPYYLLGREHKRTVMNIMSLCNLAVHATRRVPHAATPCADVAPTFAITFDVVATYLGAGFPVCFAIMFSRCFHEPPSESASTFNLFALTLRASRLK